MHKLLIPKELAACVRNAALRIGVSEAEWVRRAIEDALRTQSDDPSAADPLARLASLGAPTGDLDQMLAEIEAGRR